jgi:hypothetical protein
VTEPAPDCRSRNRRGIRGENRATEKLMSWLWSPAPCAMTTTLRLTSSRRSTMHSVSAIWVLARWYSCLLSQHVADPLAELRGLALILAKGRGSAA